MPLYEYCCKDCGNEFEDVVPFAQADEVVCSVCGSEITERVASTFSSVTKTVCPQNPGASCDMGG